MYLDRSLNKTISTTSLASQVPLYFVHSKEFLIISAHLFKSSLQSKAASINISAHFSRDNTSLSKHIS